MSRWEGGCGWGLEWRYMGRHTVQKWVEGKTVREVDWNANRRVDGEY